MMTESKANRDSVSWRLRGAAALHKWRFYPIHPALKKKKRNRFRHCVLYTVFCIKGLGLRIC